MKSSSNEPNLLRGMDYSVVQQCMHCGLCLPTCPTYDATQREAASPRGRIALMRAVADGKLEATRQFGDEMYFCLGCLACQTACPAGVEYAKLFEMARAETERRAYGNLKRSLIRGIMLKWLFTSRERIQALGRFLFYYQTSGLEKFVRQSGLMKLAPKNLRELEPLSPRINKRFSNELIHEEERPRNGLPRFRVGLITGCVQDIAFSDVNRDTVDVLLRNGCEVVTPDAQVCCGSLHGHNGELETAREVARRNLDVFQPSNLDAIIINAAGCGSFMKTYDELLFDDPRYAAAARDWTRKVRDIHEWLVEIGFEKPKAFPFEETTRVTYHDACHLCHGQKITEQPRQILRSLPGIELVELGESTWCCGSAGIYNITQPEMSMQLLDRKMNQIQKTRASVVASGNPGCNVQLNYGGRKHAHPIEIFHPVSLLAKAYRREKKQQTSSTVQSTPVH